MNYIKKRIKSLLERKSDKNFGPAVLLGGKAIILMSFFLAMQTIALVKPLESSIERMLSDNTFVLFTCYLAFFVIMAGKEIIRLHLYAFSKLDSIIRKSIDLYSVKYWRKNKKDSKFLTKFASSQNRIVRPFLKMNPRKRNALMMSLVLTYLAFDYMRFGLLQMLTIHLANLLTEPLGGIKIAS